MALNGNFVCFNSIIEKIYRDAGYQTVDWVEAIEHIGDVIGLIGVKDAYKTVTTNGLNGNPSPITVVDYRGSLPIGYVSLIGARKINIASDGTIDRIYPMVYSTDMFYQSPIKKIQEDITPGTYDTTQWESTDDEFTQTPIIVEGTPLMLTKEENYTYRINNTLIETNFEDGYVELTYNGFVTDANGFPMIPDDPKYIRAVSCYLIERIDYKKWRKGLLPDKVYQKSDSERDWAIASARSKANIPSVGQMESLKNLWLRSVARNNDYATGFKHLSVTERRID